MTQCKTCLPFSTVKLKIKKLKIHEIRTTKKEKEKRYFTTPLCTCKIIDEFPSILLLAMCIYSISYSWAAEPASQIAGMVVVQFPVGTHLRT